LFKATHEQNIKKQQTMEKLKAKVADRSGEFVCVNGYSPVLVISPAHKAAFVQI
jgi:hypothetical protein